MFLETFILAIIVGFLLKGKPGNIANTPLRGAPFIFLGLILRNIAIIFKLPFLNQHMDTIILIAPVLFVCSFALLAFGVLLNFSRWPMIIVFAGVFLNFVVVLANQGYMPVSSIGLKFAGYDMSKITSTKLDLNHILITTQTKLPFLSDIIAIPKPYPFPGMLSIGDVVMCMGLFFFVIIGMTTKKKEPVLKNSNTFKVSKISIIEKDNL